MNQKSYVRNLVFTAVCAALCIVVPMAFHTIPNAGVVFLPMHIPVLLCGLMCGWPYGLLCGLIGPLLSSLTTGMPPAAMLPSMMVECAVYGLVTGLGMRFLMVAMLKKMEAPYVPLSEVNEKELAAILVSA